MAPRVLAKDQVDRRTDVGRPQSGEVAEAHGKPQHVPRGDEVGSRIERKLNRRPGPISTPCDLTASDGDQLGGSIRRDIDTTQLGREVLATLMGLEIQWLMDPEAIDLLATVNAYVQGLQERLAPT